MRVAVLGMGQMGRALAGRLLSTGHEVTIWNRTPGRAADLVGRGAREAADPSDAARGADATILLLADDEALRDVASRLDAADAALLVVNCSTVAPATTGWLTDRFARVAAAPILGAPHAVESGQAVYLVAAAPRTWDELKDWWSDLGSVRYVGADPPLASVAKLLANYLLLTGLAALGEAVAIGRAGGLDDGFVREFLADSPLVPAALGNRLDDVVAGDHVGWFSTVLGAKDARLAAELAEQAGADVPIARLVEQRYLQAAAASWADADIAAVAELARPGDR